MAAVAIFRTHHAGARRIEAIESFRVAQWSARGAVHRAVARLRQDKNFRGTLPELGPESSLQVQSLVTIADHNGKIAIQAKSTYRHAAATYALELDPSKI
jgi:type II secretory pathway component PulK